MSELDVIAAAGPFTRATLADDLRQLGVAPGTTLLVHSSLSRLGWVAGGAQAVVLALLDVLGPSGTLVMPTHSAGVGDPERWQHPAVPEEWWPTIQDEMPAFDPSLTPTRKMGAIVECFRHVDGVRRSPHPQVSFAACGPKRDAVIEDHGLAFGLGETSPLARLYQLEASVLLLGVGHANNTSLHLGEYRANYPRKRTITRHSPILVDGQRRWTAWEDLDSDDSDFELLGADFAATGQVTAGVVGAGTARLMGQRQVVDFASTWFNDHRGRRRSRLPPAPG